MVSYCIYTPDESDYWGEFDSWNELMAWLKEQYKEFDRYTCQDWTNTNKGDCRFNIGDVLVIVRVFHEQFQERLIGNFERY